MRIDCGETAEEENRRLSEWHAWFAWHPVRVGSHDCRWLETIWRKREGVWWDGETEFSYSICSPQGDQKAK